MDNLAMWLVLIYIFLFCYAIYKAITKGGRCIPTWKGIIISALIGCLPIYLILCFFGVMGDDQYK